jgi:hypothetical protein
VGALRSELKALNTENSRLQEERGAYKALLDPKTGVGREVSISGLTVRPSTGGWKFFGLVSGGAVQNAPFKGSAVVELAGAARGEKNDCWRKSLPVVFVSIIRMALRLRAK